MYNITNIQDTVKVDGYVYCRVKKGMYGLPQSGIIAQDLLKERLAKYGYSQSQLTPGLWKHKSRPTIFNLVVDNFAMKYVTDKDAHHLIDTVKKNYKCAVDWEAKRYCRVTFK